MQGAYGDEGPQIGRRIDGVAAALAEWDRSIRAEETRLRSRLQSAEAGQAADIRVELGLLYLERSRFDDALAEFEAAARVKPEWSAVALLRGLALDAAGKAEAAGTAYLQASALEPNDPVKAYLATTRGDPAAADAARLQETLVAAARGAVRGVRRPPGAAFLEVPFRVAEPPVPAFALARYAEGFGLYGRGRYEDAIARWRDAAAGDPLVSDPATSMPAMAEGIAAFREGRLAAAVAAMERASEAIQTSSEANRILGTVLSVVGDRTKSAARLESAVRLVPGDERSWIALARLRDEAGEREAALRVLEDGIRAVPDSAELRWRLAGWLVRLERNTEAIEQYAQVSRLGAVAGHGHVHQREAALATMHLDPDRTARALEDRVRLNPNEAAAHRDLAGVYEKQGRRAEAFAELAIAAFLEPADPLTLLALGQAQLAERRDADAVEAFQMAVQLAPNLREARYGLAQALTRVGRRDEGIDQLGEFQRLLRESTERAKRDDALAAMEEEARGHSQAGRHRQAAQMWIKAAVREPAKAELYLNAAEALVSAGDLDASIQYLVKAAELDGVDDVHRRLAEVLGRLGRTRESAMARETYERLRMEDFRRR